MAGRRRRGQNAPGSVPTTTQQTTQTEVEDRPPVLNPVIDDINIANDDSSESEMETTTNTSHSKPKLQVFKGVSDKVKIDNWLKRYEMLANYYKWSDKTKIVMLGNYLEDDALNWYIENCNDNYVELKTKLINRFGLETVEPIIEFVNIRYDIKSGIKEYFETKRRYGVAAQLTESQMIPLMINNLPLKMIEYFTAVKPKTFTEFYSIAKTAENNFKRNSFKNQSISNTNSKPNFPNSAQKPKRKPPNPCRICENLGFKNRFHWSNDCRNKAKQNSQEQIKLKQ